MREGIRFFLEECAAAGKSQATAHYLFVNGMDPRGCRVSIKDHLKRGASLSRLIDFWLSTWGDD